MVTRLHERLGESEKPIIIWEPVPDFCKPEHLEAFYQALKLVDVVSPNHREQANYFGRQGEAQGAVDRDDVTWHSHEFLISGLGARGGSVVVRCGREGCYVATQAGVKWLPAYHDDAAKVVDPTGAGNTFLGGLGVALARGLGIEEAAAWGAVAASFAIEQVGLPARSDTDGEKWNSVSVRDRLDQFLGRLRESGVLDS